MGNVHMESGRLYKVALQLISVDSVECLRLVATPLALVSQQSRVNSLVGPPQILTRAEARAQAQAPSVVHAFVAFVQLAQHKPFPTSHAHIVVQFWSLLRELQFPASTRYLSLVLSVLPTALAPVDAVPASPFAARL